MSDFYDRNGEESFERTAHLDMGEIWAEFLRHLAAQTKAIAGVDIVRSWTTRDNRPTQAAQLWVNQISRRS